MLRLLRRYVTIEHKAGKGPKEENQEGWNESFLRGTMLSMLSPIYMVDPLDAFYCLRDALLSITSVSLHRLYAPSCPLSMSKTY